MADDSWLGTLLSRNAAFVNGIEANNLPVTRTPGRTALITCMDPRINLDALGVEPFDANGGGRSDVRVIRTIGAVAEDRSLIVGIHLAGIKELAIVMHTDCGNCLAKQRIDKIASSLEATMSGGEFQSLRAHVGVPWPQKLAEYLKAFDDPREAVRREVAAIRTKPIVPSDVTVHGLIYTLETGKLEVIVNGYAPGL
jgi:carbonic anhydrase